MKNTLIFCGLLIASAITWYGVFAFVSLEPNPLNWLFMWRLILIGLVLSSAGVTYEEKYLKHQNKKDFNDINQEL